MSIPRKSHGIFDYVFSLLVIASPWLFGFAGDHVAVMLAVTFGLGTAIYSALTNYELGVFGVLPFTIHRFLDIIVAIALGGASWHFGMQGSAGVAFTILGGLALLVTILTRRPPDTGTVAR